MNFDEVLGLLAEYKGLPTKNPELIQAAEFYFERRDELLGRFPRLLRMYAAADEMGKSVDLLALFEGTLFEVCWVEKFIARADSIEMCRKKIAMLLSVFANKRMTFLHDPNLAAWAVGSALIAERNSRARGLTAMFQSRDVQMLERVMAECGQHVEAGRSLPGDLRDKLKALENQGVFLPSDIYVALELAMASPA